MLVKEKFKDEIVDLTLNGDSSTFACVVGMFVELYMNTLNYNFINDTTFSVQIKNCKTYNKYYGTKQIIDYMKKMI